MRFTLFITFIFFFFSTLQSQDVKVEEMLTADEFVEEEIKGIEWLSKKSFDVGEINHNEPITVSFEFVNVEDEPILITKVKPSCSCSVTKYTKTPIGKGEKGIIEATYDAKESGSFFKTFLLLTSKSTSPNVLFIQGFVRQ